MIEEAKRESLEKTVSVLFVLMSFTADIFEVRHPRELAGGQSALLFGMAAAPHFQGRRTPLTALCAPLKPPFATVPGAELR